MTELDGEPIGTQGVGAEKFAIFRTVDTGSWLGRAFQGLGYGKEMRAAVLSFAFDGLGAQVADTEAFLDNAPSNGVSRSLGLRGERPGQPRAGGRGARHAAVPHDGRDVALAAAAGRRHRGPRRLPGPVRGRRTGHFPAPGAARGSRCLPDVRIRDS